MHSEHAVRTAASLAAPLGSTVVGFHVYAARLHETRFIQMEPALPRGYSDHERRRQREAHESLIAKGLRLISESYLERAHAVCAEAGVAFEGRLAEGRNYEQIIREARSTDCDLVVLGALGLGARRRSLIGSVCERVLRAAPCDVLVARNGREAAQGVVAAVDGSACAYEALAHALTIGEAFGQPVEAVAAYDPQFHVVAFRRLARVLSDEAAAVFRFKEQEQLHAEIIDQGLRRLYEGYLRQAAHLAAARGHQIRTTLLTGKPSQSLLDHLERRRPRFVVAGRFGQHATEGLDIGSTAENLARLAACSVLVVSASADVAAKPVDAEAERQLPWTPDAVARLEPVSTFGRGVVQRAVESYAQRCGQAEVTAEIVDQAREALGW